MKKQAACPRKRNCPVKSSQLSHVAYPQSPSFPDCKHRSYKSRSQQSLLKKGRLQAGCWCVCMRKRWDEALARSGPCAVPTNQFLEMRTFLWEGVAKKGLCAWLLGFHSKAPQIGWLKQIVFLSQFWRLEAQGQGVSRTSSIWFQTAVGIYLSSSWL